MSAITGGGTDRSRSLAVRCASARAGADLGRSKPHPKRPCTLRCIDCRNDGREHPLADATACRFFALRPDITLSQVVQDGAAPEGVDLSIHYGDPSEVADETVVLMQGRILALGTRQFDERHQIRTLKDLARAPLIHTRSDQPGWTTWRDWFGALAGTEPQGPGFSLNNYLVSLQAAEDHIGAVLGWDALVEDHLQTGRLVPLVPEALASPWPFYLRIHGPASEDARLLANWLIDQGKGSGNTPELPQADYLQTLP
ncbi:LysR substrate-binding domain-containing protein [Pannonibacter sp. Pt2-lr]